MKIFKGFAHILAKQPCSKLFFMLNLEALYNILTTTDPVAFEEMFEIVEM